LINKYTFCPCQYFVYVQVWVLGQNRGRICLLGLANANARKGPAVDLDYRRKPKPVYDM
jgi:hypothetical protein